MKPALYSALFLTLLSGCGGSKDNNEKTTVVTTTPSENTLPVANAGADLTVDEQTSVTLKGQGSDTDGTIASYLWQQVSGTSVTLTNQDSAEVSFTAPASDDSETLVFSLTVTDNKGASHTDEAKVEVVTTNLAATIELVKNTTAMSGQTLTLTGQAQDPDGSISSYMWQQTSGTTAQFTGKSTQSIEIKIPNIANEETLSFKLTVTDNRGATSSETVSIKVTPLPSQAGAITIADMNDDGLSDLIFTSVEANQTTKLWLRLNQGDGKFSSPTQLNTDLAEPITTVSTADINQNGHLDVVVATKDNIYFIEQQQKDQFLAPKNLTSDWTTATAVADFTKLPVLLPQANSNFQFKDLNGDNRPDMVWLVNATAIAGGEDYLSAKVLYVSINKGNASFHPANTIASAQSNQALESYGSIRYTIADMDKNGNNEIVSLESKYEYSVTYSNVKSNAFTGEEVSTKLLTPEQLVKNYAIYGPATVDWNEDGELDIVFYAEKKDVLLYQGMGNGEYSGLEVVTGVDMADFTLTLDLDGDTKEDFISYDYDDNSRAFAVSWQKKLDNNLAPQQILLTYQGEMLGAYSLDKSGKNDFITRNGNQLIWYRDNGSLSYSETTLDILN